jgi:nucleotide-binding universal stress UspA family protein
MNTGKEASNPFKRILFCTDFSENADFAFACALDAAQRSPDCVLYLLHVIPEPDAQFWKTYLYQIDEDLDARAKQAIDVKIAESYLPRVPEGMNFEVQISIGKDYMKILEFAEEKDVDLIVMGRQGRGAWGTVLFGNVTEKVTRKAECAVLVVPLSFKKKAQS